MVISFFGFSGFFPLKRGVRGVTPSNEVRGVTPTDAATLLHEGYDFVLTQRIQSDKLENRFSQYRQMSGRKFLVGLREIHSSERILKCRSLLKAGIDFWIEEKDSHQEQPIIPDTIMECEYDLLDASLSSDSLQVAPFIAGCR